MKAPKIVRQNENVRVVVRTYAELFEEGKENKNNYVGGSWGGPYLRAPDIYFRILEKAGGKLVRLREVAEVLGYIHDNKTGRKYPHVPFLKSLKDATLIHLTSSSPGVYSYGVNKSGNVSTTAPLLMARTFADRLFILWNEDRVYAKEFYRIIPYDTSAEVLFAALLNSTFALLGVEIYGLTNLGQGGLKHSKTTSKRLLIPSPEKLSTDVRRNLLEPFTKMANRPMRNIFEELGFYLCNKRGCSQEEHPYEYVHPESLTLEQIQKASLDRFELDRVVFDALGLTDEERLEVYRAVVQLVKDRSTKAKSNNN